MANKENKLFKHLRFLRPGDRINDGFTEESTRPRDWEGMYRNRWGHDRVVRSTHGVNCTGSCSWNIYVKDGIITYETQKTDYPSVGSDFPEYEPRGCPRGASFSWYTYSPVRVKYPYVRSELYAMWKEELAQGFNPVEAWDNIVSDPEKRARYVKVRGRGGMVRANWRDATLMIASASIHTIRKYGPDRIAGFSPIPAMSMVSYAGGTRFLSLIGGTILSFYDWYADLPPASPQVWGDQTDVPESADWYNTKYFIIWGTNLPQTRTPDAHFMVESRYNGTKVVGVSPDFAEYEKFADIWLPARAGTDGALAMAMTHVILKEFYADRQVPYFIRYAKKFTDLPFLVLIDGEEGAYRSGRFLHASDLGDEHELGDWKPVVWDAGRGRVEVPNGTQGHRWDGQNKWNLDLENQDGTAIDPALTFLEDADDVLQVDFPYFAQEQGGTVRRGVPVKRIRTKNGESVRVTTIHDLMMAHTGVGRGLPGDYPTSYSDPKPYTPAWQEPITGVNRQHVITVAREFADNAERTNGKSMIAMGGGTNHWYHSDHIYRSILNLVMLTGSQGVNGGGWAHYVGQEKVRPVEGWQIVAFAKDWETASPRLQNGTSYFYFATDQFRYEEKIDEVQSAWGSKYANKHPADVNALAARLGWLPSFPQFSQNSVDLVTEARAEGAVTDEEVTEAITKKIKDGRVDWAIENPDDPRNFPRVFFNWRSNLLGDSGKGHEYFVKHLIGGDHQVQAETGMSWEPEDVKVSETAPEGKTDLFVSIDFRMTSSGLFSDIVLPAATWYEKTDLSTTDLHPFIHPFNPAINPPWDAKSDWDTFKEIGRVFSELAKEHLPEIEEVLMTPLGHDTPGEIAQPDGKIRDWRKGEAEAVPGKTMPNLTVVKRDLANVYGKMITVGPVLEKGYAMKGIKFPGTKAYEDLKKRLGKSKREGIGKGLPDLFTDVKACETILHMSGASNGERAVEGWKALGEKTGRPHLEEIAAGHEEEAFTLLDITAQPRQTLPSPVWSGLEKDGARYSPFTVNTEYGLPWRTLTGRQSFYLDHEMMLDFGEGLPLYLPPLNKGPYVTGETLPEENGKSLTLRYLTPHQKWGIHTMFTETSPMVQLFRGWQVVWMNEKDGASIGLKDNDWIEVYNRNGAVAARAVLTYRIPPGMVYMYHAQDRTMGVPGTQATKKRGGTHNSVTRITAKPTHMIGGYSQLSYGFNYYGPTGSQRDTIAIVRPLKEVDWLER
ncbi:nitrate reductase subunit alpha [Indiicoccus explosivorum]|uniref:nitrate reductase subunit alpha n=1 Tax=Indiicoccus explosivorum TaxID=1917864 RepID=UPI000B437E85|nr:nitrate reductase subunit alpha [Indiicoccus explosivorum]